MNLVESTVNTAVTTEPLTLCGPEQPVSAICDQFFAHGAAAAVRTVPAIPGTQAPLSVGQLLGFVHDNS